MNKTSLLAVSVIVGVISISSFIFKGNDVKSASEERAVAVKENEVKQETSLGDETNTAIIKSNASDNVIAANNVTRQAPPPPISATRTRENQDSRPQAHGHEELSDTHKENAPPPAGVNQ